MNELIMPLMQLSLAVVMAAVCVLWRFVVGRVITDQRMVIKAHRDGSEIRDRVIELKNKKIKDLQFQIAKLENGLAGAKKASK